MERESAENARASLDAVTAARTGVADRLAAPWWYYPVLGLLVAQHVLAQGLDDSNWTLPSALLLCGGAFVLILTYRRLTGLTVKSVQGARTWVVLVLLGAIVMVCIGVASGTGSTVVLWAAAALALLATVLLGRQSDAALRQAVRGRSGNRA